MAFPHHYLLALLLPTGRISPAPFALLSIFLFVVNWYAWRAIGLGWQDDPYGSYTITLLAGIWSTFCILSRRLHDTGSNGLFLVPLMMLAVATFLMAIDPESFGIDPSDTEGLAMFAGHGRRLARLLTVAVFIYCVKAAGEEGENAYGPEFGDSRDRPTIKGAGGVALPRNASEAQRRLATITRARPADPYHVDVPAVPQASAPRRARQGFGRR